MLPLLMNTANFNSNFNVFLDGFEKDLLSEYLNTDLDNDNRMSGIGNEEGVGNGLSDYEELKVWQVGIVHWNVYEEIGGD